MIMSPFGLKRFYDPQHILRPEQLCGEVPPVKEVYGTMLRMAWPAALEAVLVSMVTVVDTIMVGTLGTEAIAAVGITGQPRYIILVIFFALNIGITAIVSRRKGQEDKEGANRCVRQSILITAVLCTLLSVAGGVYARQMMAFMGAGKDIIGGAVTYYRYILIGLPFTAVSLAINAAQRGVGNTKIAMVTNITANVVNVIFNYLLIGGEFGFPALGVKGAAIATVLGYVVAFLMSCHSLTHQENFLYVKFKDNFFPDRETTSLLVKIGGSAVVEQIFMRIGFIVFIKMVATLGTVSFATHQICMNIMSVSFSFGDGLGVAASSLVGQNLGRKRPDMAIVFGRAGQMIAYMGSIVLIICFVLLNRPIMSLFSKDQSIITMGSYILLLIAAMSPGQMAQVMFSGCLRGAGDTRFVALSSLLSTTIARPFFGWLFCFPLGLGVVGAWVGILSDQYVRLAVTYWRFSQGNWTKIKV